LKRSLALAALVLSANPARAGGFALYGQGARGAGMADAVSAQSSDPAAIFYNAAGIGFLEGRQLSFGATNYTLSTDFTGADPYPGAGRLEELDIAAPIPMGFYTQSLGKRAVLGLGLQAPFGLKTEWDDPDFSGRFISRLAELKAISINPTLAWRVADRVSIGAGLDVRVTSVKLIRDVPFTIPGQVLDVATTELASDTVVDFGWNMGLLAKPSDAVSLGLAYRHSVTAELGGTATFTPRPTGIPPVDAAVSAFLPAQPVPLKTALHFPAIASLGVGYHVGPWTFEADLSLYRWSSFERIDIDFVGRDDLDLSIPEEYEDSHVYRFGIERSLGPSWAVRGGYYYDESPAPAASVSPLLPDPRRHAGSLGGSYLRGPFRVDVAGVFVKGVERSTEGVNRDGFDGSYRSVGTLLCLYLGYKF
jgi:long-chain fatty acid transport protein